MPIRKRVTLRTIARELGLTIQTVSKALRGHPGMSETTRLHIVQTAEKLGYFTREQIRSLKAERIVPYPMERKTFLLVQTMQSLPFNRLLLEGLNERFASFGHRVEICVLPTNLKPPLMAAWLGQSSVASADGLFIAPSLLPKLWEPLLLALPVPKILLNFPPLGAQADSVIWDLYEATYQAAAYLRELGHVRIMYVGDTSEHQRGYILRWQAFLHAMNESRIRVDPDDHSICRRDDTAQWLAELERKLVRFAPTAVICGINGEVERVCRVCEKLGLRIPDDLSLIGFLNEQPAHLPVLTRPLLPIRESGYRAADRMLWRIANPALPYEHIRIQGDLFVGSTTAPPASPSSASV